VISVLQGQSKITAREIAEIPQVLLPDGFIQMILSLQGALDFGRGGFALLVEWASGRDADQDEGQEADDQQRGNQEEETA
jgi:hypothetical protein